MVGRWSPRPYPAVGTRYGNLVTVGEATSIVTPRQKRVVVATVCDCGQPGTVLLGNLLSGRTQGCNKCGKRKSLTTRQARAAKKAEAEAVLKVCSCGGSKYFASALCRKCWRASGRNGRTDEMTLRKAATILGLTVKGVTSFKRRHGWVALIERVKKAEGNTNAV